MHIDGTHTKNNNNNGCISCHGNKCDIIFVFPIETYPSRERHEKKKQNYLLLYFFFDSKEAKRSCKYFRNIFAFNIFVVLPIFLVK